MAIRMRLVQVPATQVKKSIDAESEEFNTCFHTQLEAPHLCEPLDGPCDLNHWLPLIASSQRLSLDAIPIISLSCRQGALIIAASKSSLVTGEMNRTFQEEIDEDIAPSFSSLTYPANGYFVRLDGCSPKDGVKGIKPVKIVQDIILCLITSGRATTCITYLIEQDYIKDSLNFGAGEDPRKPIRLYFVPFNPRMSTAREYRVFCPPPVCQILAISQYKWHEASMFAGRPENEKEIIITRITEEAHIIHKAILETDPEAERSILLRKQGFSFDVMYDEDTERCCLIKLNCFGTRSGCGSCLFHWLRDEDVLYGKVKRDIQDPKSIDGDNELEIEFRISV